MKHLLLTTIVAVFLVGCGESQQSSPPAEAKPAEPVAETAKPTTPPKAVLANKGADPARGIKPEPPAAKAPDISIFEPAEPVVEVAKQSISDLLRKPESSKPLPSWLETQPPPPGSTILGAAYRGHIEFVKQHIAAGADVNAKDSGGKTPLYYARAWPMTELLISNGADVNTKDKGGRTPLHWVVMKGEKENVELLIAAGADVNATVGDETALDLAKQVWEYVSPEDKADKKEIGLLLRKHGGKTGEELRPGAAAIASRARKKSAELKAERIEEQNASALRLRNLKQANKALFNASVKGKIDAVKQHLTNGADVNAKNGKNGWTSLHEAVNKEIAELLIEQGANVNAIGLEKRTPLHRASMKGRKGVAELLIDKGADVNAKSVSGSFKGATPLDMAKNNEIVTLLRKHGGKTGEELKGNRKSTEALAKIEKTVSGGKNSANLEAGRALIIAAARGNTKAVNQHLDSGTDVNAVGLLGRTPLFGAAWNNHKEIVELLLANGANINAKDKNGETPLDGSDTIEISDLLRKHGGKTGDELKAEGK